MPDYRKICSIAYGAVFLFTGGNHWMQSLSAYTLPLLFDNLALEKLEELHQWEGEKEKAKLLIGRVYGAW